MAGAVQTRIATQEDEVTLSPHVGAADFETAFGEKLSQTLDLDTWMLGEDIVTGSVR